MIRDDDEKFQLIDLNCRSEEFIKVLYNILRQGEDNNCFTEGAFVISDQKGEVFKILTHGCVDEKGENNEIRVSYLGYITHDVFLRPTKFKSLRSGSRLNKEFLIDEGVLQEGYVYNSFKQYENTIRDKKSKPKSLEFLCNPVCNEDPNKAECIESRRNTKAIILFYPFVVEENLNMGLKEYRRYLYLKLERNKAISYEHAKDAYEAYLNPVMEDESGFDRRRERTTKQNEKRYKDNLNTKDLNFYQKFYNIDKDDKELKYYNEFVRSNDEFYIPQKITSDIINKLS